MIVRKSDSKYTFYRYGGSIDGKNLEVRVGSCPVGTNPESIPHELVDNLTPKEVKFLKDELAKEQQVIMNAKIAGIVSDLKDLTSAIGSGFLDLNSVVDLNTAAQGFLKCARRVVPKSPRKSGNAQSQ